MTLVPTVSKHCELLAYGAHILTLYLKSTRAGWRYTPLSLTPRALGLASLDTDKDRPAHSGFTMNSRATGKDAANHDGRSSTDADYGKARPRSASCAKMTYPSDLEQNLNQRGQIAQLVRDMAALRLADRIEILIEEEFEVLEPNSMVAGPQHAATLDDEYVMVESECARAGNLS
ncbi:hypothetical protein IG631_22427 [Alternaria alternata]|jgi:hypothetical protein|nr:hypothetical protein IG631_22427 [Alternaria alternata]